MRGLVKAISISPLNNNVFMLSDSISCRFIYVLIVYNMNCWSVPIYIPLMWTLVSFLFLISIALEMENNYFIIFHFDLNKIVLVIFHLDYNGAYRINTCTEQIPFVYNILSVCIVIPNPLELMYRISWSSFTHSIIEGRSWLSTRMHLDARFANMDIDSIVYELRPISGSITLFSFFLSFSMCLTCGFSYW